MQEEIWSVEKSFIKSGFDSKKFPFIHGVLQNEKNNYGEPDEENRNVQIDSELV